MAALDGLRGLALAVVLVHHGGFDWARGGYLGVTSFFVLSGFLITSLLLTERAREGRLDLPAFWARRARRLVPAGLVTLVLVALYGAIVLDGSRPGLFGDALATVGWVANWRFIAEGQSYGDLFSGPSPLQHAWSLAVEEQVYLALPLLALVLLGRRPGPGRRWAFGLGLGALAVASTVLVAVLHDPGEPALRAYYGTDTRAAEPLIGALLALALIGPLGLRRLGPGLTRAADVGAVAALAASAWLWRGLERGDSRLYDGGFLLAALLTAIVLVAATQPGTLTGRLLDVRPLRWLGRASYGAYLYHWPLFLWLSPRRTGLDGWSLLGVRLAFTLGLATVSLRLVEQPVRLGRWPSPRLALAGWANAAIAGLALVAAVTIVPVTAGDREEVAAAEGPATTAAARAAGAAPRARAAAAGPGAASRAAVPAARPGAGGPAAAAAPPTTKAPARGPRRNLYEPPKDTRPPAPPSAFKPAAVRIAVVGDSLAADLALGLRRWSDRGDDAAVYDLSIVGCPLSRGGVRRLPSGFVWEVQRVCGWWADPEDARRLALERWAPDVVVVQDAFNELPDRKLPEWREHRRPGDPRFDLWLDQEYQALIDVLGPGVPVLFLNAACADWDGIDEWQGEDEDMDGRVTTLNARTYAVQGTKPRVTLGDLHEVLCPDGTFSDSVLGVEGARPDGFHLTEEAAVAVAARWLGPLALDTAGVRAPTPSTTAPVAPGSTAPASPRTVG